jgi:hypothetical protein
MTAPPWPERIVGANPHIRAPQPMVNRSKDGACFHYEGYAPHPIDIRLGAGKSPKVRIDELKGKGSHAALYYGSPRTTLKDRRKEIGLVCCARRCANWASALTIWNREATW